MEMGTGSLPGGTGIQSLLRLLDEMGRRRVWRTALAYGAACFVLLQLGEILFPAFGAPDWALRILVVSCFLGFPLVLCLSWVFDVTAQGIRITRPEGAGAGRVLPRLALLTVTLAVIGGMGWWTVQDSIQGAAAEPSAPPSETVIPASSETPNLSVRSLAVLPLDDFSQEEGDAFFTAGLHEELISQLSRSSSARVLSRTTVAQYDRSGKTMPVVAQELGVEGVVEGSVYRSGDRVRITVQLIHGPTDTHLWADSYEGTTEDAIALQRKVAEAIAKAIQAELFGPEDSAPQVKLASGTKAEEEYLRGRYEQAKGTPEGLQLAMQHFRNALEDDSSFAPAHAGLAGTQLLVGLQEGGTEAMDTALEREAVLHLEKAFTLDEESPEAQAILITMKEALAEPITLGRTGRVQVVLDSGAVLEPSVALEASEFGRLLSRVVIQGAEPGEATSPSHRVAAARRLAAASHFGDAERMIRQTIETWPDSREAWEALEDLNAKMGRYQEVVEIRGERLAADSPEAAGQIQLQELRDRVREEGARGYWSWRMSELEAMKEEGQPVSPVEMARASAALGERAQAYQYLDQALAQRDRELLTLWTDPVWDDFRSESRFKDILTTLREMRGRRPGPLPQ